TPGEPPPPYGRRAEEFPNVRGWRRRCRRRAPRERSPTLRDTSLLRWRLAHAPACTSSATTCESIEGGSGGFAERSRIAPGSGAPARARLRRRGSPHPEAHEEAKGFPPHCVVSKRQRNRRVTEPTRRNPSTTTLAMYAARTPTIPSGRSLSTTRSARCAR